MSEEKKNEDFVNVTDCLEAVGVFKSVKNFLFLVILVCIVLLAVSFWAAELGYIKTASSEPAKVDVEAVQIIEQPTEPSEIDNAAAVVAQAVEQINLDVKTTGEEEAVADSTKTLFNLKIDFIYVKWLIRACDFVLIMASIMYCLALLFSLKISLLGTMGGISHIAKAFFLSLFMVVFLFPWQRFFGTVEPIVVGAVYTPGGLLTAVENKSQLGIIGLVFYYLRFVGWWILVVVLLLAAQRRSNKWTKATLRRLGIE